MPTDLPDVNPPVRPDRSAFGNQRNALKNAGISMSILPMKFLPFAFLLTFLMSGFLLHAEPLKIIPRSEWQAAEPRPYQKQTPERFTIHHTAVLFDEQKDAARHIRNTQSWGMGPDREWADIPYHFLIAPTGEIFEGRHPLTEGESATPYDTAGHLQINLLGNFNEQEPTRKQLRSLVRLLAWAHREYGISTDTIAAHRDLAQTACPGDNLYKFVADGTLKKEADRLIRKGGKGKGKNARPEG